ncbi:MAG: M48 family metallopeptidase [Brevirhabdus sp.]
MADEIEIAADGAGACAIRIAVRRSARARRLSLRVSALDGRATLSVPKGIPMRVAEGFVRDKAPWLRRQMARMAPALVPHPGALFPFMGKDLNLVSGTGRAARVEGDSLVVPAHGDHFAPRLAAFVKETARARLVAASDRYAAALGRPYTRITLRDTRSRWGSCTDAGNLMYSWRLILAPLEVLDYVAAHEVAHLAEMNHSSAFWDTVARLYPGYEHPRAWLKREGAALHRWQFG